MEEDLSLLFGTRCGDRIVGTSEPRRGYYKFVKHRIYGCNVGKLTLGVADIGLIRGLYFKSGF